MRSFHRIIFIAEVKALAGSSWRVLWALIAILLLTILSLGLSYGTLKDLRARMSNPFTNWVDIPISLSVEPKVDAILDYFRQPVHRNQYELKSLSRYDTYYARFIGLDPRDTLYLRGRTVEPDEPVLEEILTKLPGNVIRKQGDFREFPCGIIVTRRFLQSLGYSSGWNQVHKVLMPVGDHAVWIDILAVVKELPNNCLFISGPVLPNMRNLPIGRTGFIDPASSNVMMISFSRDLSDDQVSALVKEMEPDGVQQISRMKKLDIDQDRQLYIFQFTYALSQVPDHQSWLARLQSILRDKNPQFYQVYNCNTQFSQVEHPDNFAFQFDNLGKIRDFKRDMQEEFNVEVSMQQIESAENFFKVSALTLTTSIVLFVFAMMSLGFYVANMIRSHLESIATHLGTMKAFGLPNRLLFTVYIRIMSLFFLIALLVAGLLALGFQVLLRTAETGIPLDVFNFRTLFAIGILFGLAVFLTWAVARKILVQTPGNLIYRRKKEAV